MSAMNVDDFYAHRKMSGKQIALEKGRMKTSG